MARPATKAPIGTKPRVQNKNTRPTKVKVNPKKDEGQKSKGKRFVVYSVVILIMLSLFYAFQWFQMQQIRASLEGQITQAESRNASDGAHLQGNLSQIREMFPGADAFTADPVFVEAPMAGRQEAYVQYLFDSGEESIKEARDRAPLLFLTDIIMPGAQQSNDDHYRETLKQYVASPEFVEFSTLKLTVDDLVSGIKHCGATGEGTDYGYNSPVPSPAVQTERAAVIAEAAKRHLCP